MTDRENAAVHNHIECRGEGRSYLYRGGQKRFHFPNFVGRHCLSEVADEERLRKSQGLTLHTQTG